VEYPVCCMGRFARRFPLVCHRGVCKNLHEKSTRIFRAQPQDGRIEPLSPSANRTTRDDGATILAGITKKFAVARLS